VTELSTKPFLIRAIYDWCVECGFTPYLAVRVDEQTQVPVSYVKDGEIVLNLSLEAVHNLQLGNERITCAGRFGGVPHNLIVPVPAVIGIFAKENGQGLVFHGKESMPTPPPPDGNSPQSKPRLRVVK
jgi:stringent starvation protein B